MRPLILDFKVPQIGEEGDAPFTYSATEGLNVVTIEGRTLPFIESATQLMELKTKTKVAREDDDIRDQLELRTETRAVRERDDHHDSFMELKTKTYVAREGDDNGAAAY